MYTLSEVTELPVDKPELRRKKRKKSAGGEMGEAKQGAHLAALGEVNRSLRTKHSEMLFRLSVGQLLETAVNFLFSFISILVCSTTASFTTSEN